MTRSDLVARISAIYPYMSTKNVDRIVCIVLDRITEALKNGDRVELRGFGSFCVRERAPLKGRNPKTGAKVELEKRRAPFFRAGKQLNILLNKGFIESHNCGKKQ